MEGCSIEIEPLYRVTLVVEDLGWVELNFDVPLFAKFCWGSWEFCRIGWAARQENGTSNQSQPNPGPQPPVSHCRLDFTIGLVLILFYKFHAKGTDPRSFQHTDLQF